MITCHVLLFTVSYCDFEEMKIYLIIGLQRHGSIYYEDVLSFFGLLYALIVGLGQNKDECAMRYFVLIEIKMPDLRLALARLKTRSLVTFKSILLSVKRLSTRTMMFSILFSIHYGYVHLRENFSTRFILLLRLLHNLH